MRLTYSLNAYLPWEGLNVVFNGTDGRLEMKIVEKSYVNAGGKRGNRRQHEQCDITVFPMFAEPWKAEFSWAKAATAVATTPCWRTVRRTGQRPATARGRPSRGAMSILTGIAGNISMQQRPVNWEFELVSRLAKR